MKHPDKRIRCRGYEDSQGEYACGYDLAEFSCDDCICNGGTMSPRTGKEFTGNRTLYLRTAVTRDRRKEGQVVNKEKG
jgi:hypothetical protein